MKNPNRFGTCYRLSGKRRKPWIARAYMGKGNGYKTIGYFATKTEGQTALLEYKIKPFEHNPSTMTLRDVFEAVVEQKRKDVKETTIMTNYIHVFAHLAPIEGYVFKDLRPVHYQQIFDSLAKSMKKSSLKQLRSLLSTLYGFAIVNDIVGTDYSKGIVVRGCESLSQPFFTFDELSTIKNNLNAVANADIVYLLCVTGLRPSEMLSITRDNVDMEKRIIHDVGVKSEKGKIKRVPISDSVFEYVEARLEKSYYLLQNTKGKPVSYSYFRKHVYTPALEAMGLPYKPPKSCRHTFANLTHGRLSEKARTSIIGHTDSKMTDEYYTDLEDMVLRDEYKAIDQFLTKL